MPVQFKRGQTFSFAGQLTKKDGTPFPLIGSTLYCDIRTQPKFAFVQHMTCTITDLPTSAVLIYASSADTTKWLAEPHLLDIRLVAADGSTLISNSQEIDVLDTVTQEASTA